MPAIPSSSHSLTCPTSSFHPEPIPSVRVYYNPPPALDDVHDGLPMSFGKGIVRVTKNITKGYSDVQVKVRSATSNDPLGPTGLQMNELAQMTYNPDDFVEIMEMLDKRLNDKGKYWRHVFKSLTVLDYLLHSGSENVVIYMKNNVYIIKTLKEFQYIDEYGKDQGANVRQKAKDISNLLTDDNRLRQARRTRARLRYRMSGSSGTDEDDDYYEPTRRRSEPPKRSTTNTDDNKKPRSQTVEERDLAAAIKLSEEEEQKRQKQLAESNKGALFDDQNHLIDFDTPTQTAPPLQVQYTAAVVPQFTAVPAQYTSFNMYEQQAQQEAMQAEYARQQQEWQIQQQAQAQQEEWLRQQQMLQLQQQQLQLPQQPMLTQPTGYGSNNPFAAPDVPMTPSNFTSYSSPSPRPQASAPLSYTTPGTSFSPPPPQPRSAPPAPGPQRQLTRIDQQHTHLADLFANREDGIDSFGNFGQLRYGQQAGRLLGQPTGASTHSMYN
ncbi:hypothetical protein EIP91_000182 [Steccherinum ochraceum]|uniref:ENTH domain-containing protein n=1 Tax=Steccherinum ochraceum TaxID=92696 RepID=A0A4R0RQC2_9APHY|nr:hypothetical protein EIP91_000182 [Steccherinum ochraceum]